MSPKEKAAELISKFNFDREPFSEYGVWDDEVAKKCALICAEEILDSYEDIYDDYIFNKRKYDNQSFMKKYWQELKKEIEKL